MMGILEIRRHAYTKKGAERGKGSHLSHEGVRLARAIGETIGHCDRVFTSTVPRTLETALAMGYAVDEQLHTLANMPDEMLREVGHHERWAWEHPFLVFAQIIAQGGATAQVGQQLRETWQMIGDAIPVTGKALIITHGRLIEIGLLTCLPEVDVSDWGKAFEHCEGIQLSYEEGHFHNIEFLRLDKQIPPFHPTTQ